MRSCLKRQNSGCAPGSPESEYVILPKRNWPYYRGMNEQERECVRLLCAYIGQGGYTLDSLQAELYAIPKRVFPDKAEDKNALQSGPEQILQRRVQPRIGPRPRAAPVSVSVRGRVLRLSASARFLSARGGGSGCGGGSARRACRGGEKQPAEDRYVAEPAPLRETIDMPDFDRCDLRVCKVLAAKPMRKTNKLMKLTLHDGIGEEVIVSSIADQYEPEMLVGKKIVVLLNLRPHKIRKRILAGDAARVRQCGRDLPRSVCGGRRGDRLGHPLKNVALFAIYAWHSTMQIAKNLSFGRRSPAAPPSCISIAKNKIPP